MGGINEHGLRFSVDLCPVFSLSSFLVVQIFRLSSFLVVQIFTTVQICTHCQNFQCLEKNAGPESKKRHLKISAAVALFWPAQLHSFASRLSTRYIDIAVRNCSGKKNTVLRDHSSFQKVAALRAQSTTAKLCAQSNIQLHNPPPQYFVHLRLSSTGLRPTSTPKRSTSILSPTRGPPQRCRARASTPAPTPSPPAPHTPCCHLPPTRTAFAALSLGGGWKKHLSPRFFRPNAWQWVMFERQHLCAHWEHTTSSHPGKAQRSMEEAITSYTFPFFSYGFLWVADSRRARRLSFAVVMRAMASVQSWEKGIFLSDG